MIKGLPQLTQARQTLNATLPDASVASNGAQNNGFKSFNFIINDDANAIRSDLGVYLHINHASTSDLRVVLVSPAGTRITLHANTAHQGDDLVRYWTSQHDDLLQAFDGESLAGNWRLEVTDYAQGNSGELVAWQMGRVTGFDCQKTDDLGPNNALDIASSGGGALSWPLLLVGLIWGGWRARQ
ncbi:proprotein convertase P-domain-containing protein [Salinivibrio socompensis]|uniref:proprotein convertase P-domain-containing protein n=1 Tax=Salinivibrio socompensis TaxID=1510206 RepID=UPI001F0AF647|nr:proprotein convertase P-domain-containing protein [Salinivibrio socompensis]